VYIGSGPSTVFSVLTLIRNHYKGNICILEKGNPIETRDKSEVISGFGGAGTFSDSKLSSALDVGGVIPGLTQKEYSVFEKYLLDTYNIFKSKTSNKEVLVWDTTEPFDTGDTGLEWNLHNTCHIGTENGQAIYKVMESFLSSQPNVRLGFNCNVVNIDFYNGNYIIYLDDNTLIFSKRVVLATGQKDILASKLIDKFKLNSKSRPFQLGIRVEDTINDGYKKLIKANYDFKLAMDVNWGGGISTHTRTFCCNSGNAHVCAERTDEGFIAFNGHAYKTPDPKNKTVNYGIMVEAEGLKEYNSKESQVDLMKKINGLPFWLHDNFNDSNLAILSPKRKLLDGFQYLKGIYPDKILYSLTGFVSELNQIVDLSNAYFYYPEVKLSGMIPDVDYNTFETKQPGLYMIGDCLITRGIVKSSYTGYKLALGLLNKKD
jgi:uncharacterized FAD-dependent dehydrogenase